MRAVIALVLLCLVQSFHAFQLANIFGSLLTSFGGDVSLVTQANGTHISLITIANSGYETVNVQFGDVKTAYFDNTGLSLLEDTSLFSNAIDDDTSISLKIAGSTIAEISIDGLSTVAGAYISTDRVRSLNGNLTVSAGNQIKFQSTGSTVASIKQLSTGRLALEVAEGSFLLSDVILPTTLSSINMGPIAMFGTLNMNTNTISNGSLGVDMYFQAQFEDSTVSTLSVDLKHGSTVYFKFNETGVSTYDFPPIVGSGSDEITLNDQPQTLTNKAISFNTAGGAPSILDFYEKTSSYLTFGGAIPRTNVTVNITRIGNVVTLTFPDVQVICNDSLSIGTFDPFPALYERFSPPTNLMFFIPVIAGTPWYGRITIFASGVLQIDADQSGSAFYPSSIAGIAATSVTYSV